MHLTNISITFLWIRAVIFFIKVVSDLKFGHFYFFGPPLTSATSEAGWKTSNFNVEKREEFGYLYEKLSILSIGGARLIFMNSSKCPTKWLIKKWDVVLSGSCACLYSLSQHKRILACLVGNMWVSNTFLRWYSWHLKVNKF